MSALFCRCHENISNVFALEDVPVIKLESKKKDISRIQFRKTKLWFIIQLTMKMKRFSIESRKTKTINYKLPKARENAGDNVLILFLIGWWSGASFLDQSQCKVKQKQSNPGLIWHSIENFPIRRSQLELKCKNKRHVWSAGKCELQRLGWFWFWILLIRRVV